MNQTIRSAGIFAALMMAAAVSSQLHAQTSTPAATPSGIPTTGNQVVYSGMAPSDGSATEIDGPMDMAPHGSRCLLRMVDGKPILTGCKIALQPVTTAAH